MAVAKVFDLPELLENILLRIRPANLLRLKRVNKTWQCSIEDTIRLRRATFLAPDGRVQHSDHERLDRHGYVTGPEYASSLDHILEPAPILDRRERVFPRLVTPDLGPNCCESPGYFWHVFVWADTAIEAPYIDPSTIDSMLITQPPIHTVRIDIQHWFGEPGLCSAILRDPHGITVDLVMDTHARMWDSLTVEQQTMAHTEAPKLMFTTHFTVLDEDIYAGVDWEAEFQAWQARRQAARNDRVAARPDRVDAATDLNNDAAMQGDGQQLMDLPDGSKATPLS